MFCPHCGLQVRDDGAFCTHCGGSLAAFKERLAASGEPDAESAAGGAGAGSNGGGEFAVPWRGGQVALGTALVGIAFLLISGVALLVEQLGAGPAWGAWLASHAIGVVILVAVWLLGQRPGQWQIPSLDMAILADLGLRRPRTPWPAALLLAALALGLSLSFTALYAWLMRPLGIDLLVPPDVPREVVFSGLAAAWSFEALAGWTPLTEELFFRGFVMAGLVHRYGVAGAVAGSSLIFAVFHLHPGVIVPIFVAGLLLAVLYRATGSLWPAIIAHAAQNTIALVAIMYGG